LRYLADQGIENSRDALKATEQMTVALQHLDQSTLTVGATGGKGAAVLTSPHTDLPLLTATGPVDAQGVWHPQIDGFAIGTPAQQQLMTKFTDPTVIARLKANGIRGFAPTFSVTAPPNPNARPAPPQTTQEIPSMEEIEASPAFQQLPPDQQQLVRERYFDTHMAMTPAVKEAVRQNPGVYGPLKQSITQTVQGALSGLPDEPMSNLVRQLAGGVASVAELTAAAAKGATAGLLPGAGAQAALGAAAGDHPIVEGLARGGTDLAVGSAIGMPIIGSGLMEGARRITDPGAQGYPVYTNAADLVKESVPLVGAEPTSRAAYIARGALGAGLMNLVGPHVIEGAAIAAKTLGGPVARVAGRVLAAPARKFAQLTGPYARMIRDLVKNLTVKGSWTGEELTQLQKAAAASNSSEGYWLAEKSLEGLPDIRVMASGTRGAPTKLRVTLRDGRIIDPKEFSKEFGEEMEKVLADPMYVPKFGDQPFIRNISAVEGTQPQINALFKTNGMQHLTVETNYAVKGVKMRARGDLVQVYGPGVPTQTFDSWKAARRYVDSLPASPTSMEDAAYKLVWSEGQNPYYAVSRMERLAVEKAEGEIPEVQQFPEIGARLTVKGQIPKTRMMEVELITKIPLYTKAWVPIEAGLARQKAFMAPYLAQLEEMFPRRSVLGQWRRKYTAPGAEAQENNARAGYTYLMETQPGSQQWDKVIRDYKLNPETGKKLRAWFEELLPKFGLETEEFLQETLPRIQQFGLYEAYPSGQIPKSAYFFAKNVAEGTLPLSMREPDMGLISHALLQQGSFSKFVGRAWEEAATLANGSQAKLNAHAKLTIDTYLRAVKGWGPESDKTFMNAMGQATKRLLAVPGEVSTADAEQLGKQLYFELYAYQAGGFYAFRPSSVTKQFFSLFQTIYPRFGERATYEGVKDVLLGRHADVLKKAGVYAQEFNQEGGVLARGTGMVNAADMKLREMAGLAQRYSYNKALPEFLATKNEAKFLKDSRVGLMHPVEQQRILDYIRQGQARAGESVAIKSAVDETNFDYSPQNRPPILMAGVGGRLFGQFGVYPFNYAHYLARGLTRGDLADRAAWLARWTGSNYLMQETFKGVFGADATNYLWHYPVWFHGGPMWDVVTSVPASIFARGQERSKAQKTILGAPLTFVPGHSEAGDVVDAFSAPTAQDFIREMALALPTDAEHKKLLDWYKKH
jgi:hypothetical protein